MSLPVYLDDCANAHALLLALRSAGHQAIIPADVGLDGEDDVIHFRFTKRQGMLLLTKNPNDFRQLLTEDPLHPGILAVYQDNDSHRDMGVADIVRAIGNLEAAGVPVAGQFHVLNQWRY